MYSLYKNKYKHYIHIYVRHFCLISYNIPEWTRALNARDVSWTRLQGMRAKRYRKTFCQFVVSCNVASAALLSCLGLLAPCGLDFGPPGSLPGPFPGLPGTLLGNRGRPLVPSWRLLGALGRLLDVPLGRSWLLLGSLGLSWGHLGPLLGLISQLLGGSEPRKPTCH